MAAKKRAGKNGQGAERQKWANGFLSGIIESSPDIIAAVDASFHYVVFNEAYRYECRELYGVDIREGSSLVDLLADLPEDQKKALRLFGRALQGETVSATEAFGDPCKLRKHYELRINPIHDNNGCIIGAAQIGRDITDKKRAEDVLRKSAENLAKAQRIAQTGSYTLDTREDRGQCSDEFYHILGIAPRDHFSFESFLDFVYPEDRDKFEREYRGAIAHGRAHSKELRIVRPDGTIRTIYGEGEPVFDETGKTVQMFGFMQDITERKRAEEALRERERQLAEGQVLTGTGSWEMDLATGEVAFSDNMLQILGLHRGRHTYDEFRDMVHPEDRGRRDAAIEDAIDNGNPYDMGYRIVLPANNLRHIHAIGRTILNSRGRPVKFISTIEDITERKRAEEALRDSQAHMNSIFRAAPTGIGVVVDRVIREANDRLCQMTGYTREELLGKSARVFYPGDEEFGRVGRVKYEEIRRQGTGSVETRWRRKDGRIIDVLLSSTPLEPDNLDAGVTFTALDITERKRAEEELAAARDHLTADLSGMAKLQEISTRLVAKDNLGSLFGEIVEAAIEITDADMGNIQMVNEKGELKIVESRGFSQLWLDNFNNVDEGSHASCGEAMAIGKRVIVEDVTTSPIFMGTPALAIQLAEGVRAVQSTPLFSRSGRLLGMFSTHYRAPHRPEERELFLLDTLSRQAADLIERMQSEGALKEARTQAELYLDLMGHDISNMHQIILGRLELAQDVMDVDGRLEGDDREFIDVSVKTLQRSARLIQNIRNIQKLRSGEFQFMRMDLGEVLDETVKGYADLPGRDVSIAYEPVNGCCVTANPLLKDIFNNLVDNAVKHCDDPVRICVSLSLVSQNGSHFYRVVVEDNGRGIPDDRKSSIFNRLDRGKSITMGTGLGLYIVKTLVEGFGGMIRAEDRVPGDHTKGASFVVMLPAFETQGH